MTAIDRALLARVTEPVETASGLPNAFYTDAGLFQAEKQAVFAANWACIGFGKDVPQGGDVRPVDFLGRPLLLVRDGEGIIRVFQNVCRHRGMILVDKPARLSGPIRCPYHSWAYDLTGRLRATPHVGGPGKASHPCVDKAALGLIEVRSALFMDMIFVNLSGEAPAFAEYVAPLTRRWSEFTGQNLHHGGPDCSVAFELATNWKLAAENYCESYHLPWVHPGLNSYSRLEDHYNIAEPRAFSGQGSEVYNPQLDADGRRFPSFPGLGAKWDHAAEYVTLYPNVLLGVHKDHFFAMMLEPVAPDRTLEHLEIYYAAPEIAGPDWAAMRRTHVEMWRQVFLEDVSVVEGMQRGRSAPGFDGGKFSPVMDAPTHCFHDWVARQFQAV
jgi:phenylpropionate dioxygenase-like ring-hydroxylating dioxygenase large terminal subunit